MGDRAIVMLSVDGKAVTADLDRAGYRKMGIEVRRAHSFDEAERAMRKGEIEVVTMNLDFPGVDALAYCQHLKRQEQTKLTPVVLTSVQGDSRTKAKAIQAGADLFVVQPVPRQVFVEQLKQLLSKGARNTQRVELKSFARVAAAGSPDRAFECPIGDLSRSGILLETDRSVAVGTLVTVSFELPDSSQPVIATGEVVRILKKAANDGGAHGLGVRFQSFESDGERILSSFITKTQAGSSATTYYL